MKIVYFSRGIPRSTHGLYMDLAAEALRNVGNEVIPCFPIGSDRSSGEQTEQARLKCPALRAAAIRQRLPRIVWNIGQLAADALAYRPLLQACKEHRPDLIHESYLPFSTSGLRVARSMRTPLILGVHELARHVLALIASPLRRYARRVDRGVVLASDGVMCISKVLRDEILRWGYPEDRLLVLHNAVDPEPYERAAAQRDEARRELKARNAVVVGYLQAWNVIERFEAMARVLEQSIDRVLDELPSTVFLLVGGGIMHEELQRRLRAKHSRRNALRFVGQVAHQEVPRYLAATDVAICAEHSTFTSPMKLFEYMASALPIVAPRQANICEILEEGRTALLFPPGDSTRLGDCIIQLARLPELARRLGLEAKREVLARHTWRAYGRRLSDFAAHMCSLPPRSYPPQP